MNKNQILDLMKIPRWELREKNHADNSDNQSALAVNIIQAAAQPQFISIVENEALNSDELQLANAIAKACKVETNNHLIVSISILAKEELAKIADFTLHSGVIVLFSESLANVLPALALFKNWTIVPSTTLKNLQTNPSLKKQLWQDLQRGMIQ